jgi:hypothetical protein
MEHGFTPGPRSRLKRYSELGHYDHATLFKVLDAAMIANIGYAIDGQSFGRPCSGAKARRSTGTAPASRMIARMPPGSTSVGDAGGRIGVARSPFNPRSTTGR